ncbi:MAG: hydrogenase formation protein HypD [Pirellulales bacterium]|nr:hydrogenase formation protein HypD [Pirellulales bacterium]
MKYADEFRDRQAVAARLATLGEAATRRWTIMEVCGGQTHNLLRYGLPQAIDAQVELIHGPGCPVCVTAAATIDRAISLAQTPGCLVASFGDMLRVPGSSLSLQQARARGAAVQLVYSPLDAVALAQREPARQVVFLAVGFETTAPATALAVLQAARWGLTNFSLLVAHVRVLPAMELIAGDAACRIDGFLAAGHVCTVTGANVYEDFVSRHRLPVAVTGFEPVDLLDGLLACVRLLEARRPAVANAYVRAVSSEGNRHAQAIVEQVFEPCDRTWRGLGTVPGGGLQLRSAWSEFCAERRFGAADGEAADGDSRCPSARVLTGQMRPTQCPYFGRECTPLAPLGAPMVSDEGACSAYYRYGRVYA